MAEEVSVATELFAGGVAGAAGIIATQPMDTIRIRLQTQDYGGMLKCCSQTLRHEGVRGFYKGLASPVLTVGLMNSALFLSYNWILNLRADATEPPSLRHVFIAGSVAGVLSATINSPTELVKCLSQTNVTNQGYLYEEYLIFKQVLRNSVSRAAAKDSTRLSRGLLLTWARDIPSYGVYFACYEAICRKFGDNSAVHLIGGGICGQVSWAMLYPVDVVKTKWQVSKQGEYKSVYDCARRTFREGGIRAFYCGFGVTMLKAFPQNATLFVTYEAIKSAFS